MRTFLLILLAFVSGVMVLVAVLAWQGRAAREYGLEAVRAAQREGRVAQSTPCQSLLKRELPATVLSCVVNMKEGKPTATLRLEGGREFRVTP